MTGPIGWLRSLVGSEVPVADSATVTAPPVPSAGADAVRRALSCVGRGVYRLGRGGRRPDATAPFDAGGLLDCSGFVSWCLGLDRYQPGRIGGDWISTDSIVRDATGPRAMFREVKIGEARPGDLVVYGGRHVGGVRVAIGHTAVIVAVNGPGWAGLDCVDCAARKGAAVGHRPGTLWGKKNGIVARRVG